VHFALFEAAKLRLTSSRVTHVTLRQVADLPRECSLGNSARTLSVQRERQDEMGYAIPACILGCGVAATVILLVDPTRQVPPETVDSVAGCVEKYWRGKPVEQWTVASHMDANCRALLNEARGAR
jgi:hypothetical protein